MIVPVQLQGPKGVVSTYAMLDSGSTITLLNSEIAEELGLEGKVQPLVYDGLHPTAVENTSMTVNLEILSSDGKKRFSLKNVKTISRTLPYQSVKKSAVEKYSQLRGITGLHYACGQPKILIGMDNAHITLSDKVIRGGPNGPYAARTELGWVLVGRVAEGSSGDYNFLIQERDEELHQMVKHYFSTESFGVKVSEKIPRSREDCKALEILEATSRRVDDRWESGLLRRKDEIHLPESRRTAFNRLKSTEVKMDKNTELADWYIGKIAEYEQKGYIRKLSEAEAAVMCPRTWFLPHFVTYHPNKPGKPRLVFDAAARSRGVSLNDNLLTGPDLVSPLSTVLFKLRQRKYAVAADISEMFLQVRIRDEDRCSQRFLWRGKDQDREPDTYQLQVMFFGSASSPCTAQYVKNRNASEFLEEYPDVQSAVCERHYVDDFLDSTDTCEEAQKLVRDVTEVHRRGGYKICNWMVNCREVLRDVPVELRANALKDLSPDSELPSGRVLGLWWNPDEDKFMWKFTFNRIKPEVLNGTEVPTKRDVLRLVMSLFDPLGFLAHFSVKAKILLQDIWRSGVGWDDQIAHLQCEKWKALLCELRGIEEMKIPRCYNSQFSSSVEKQLHIFCDSSELAFCTVAYWRIKSEDQVETAFVTAKTHVAPLKPMSVPRLELQAAVMAVRLASSIRDGHDVSVENVFFWTDSRTVLCWLRADGKRFLQFVAHRVGEIQESTDPSQWNWVPTNENVSDEGTRDNKECDFREDSRWLNGPAFLKLPAEEWPKEKKQQSAHENEEEIELKKEYVGICVPYIPLMKPEGFSSWTRLVRVTAWVFRFVNRTRKMDQKREGTSPRELLPHEIQNSETFWFKASQREDYAAEVDCLSKGMKIPKNSSMLALTPMLDREGILRMRGRMGATLRVDDEFKNPVILNRKNQITRLLVSHHHEKNGHHGMEKVVNDLRRKFVIPSLRVAVRSAWSSCQKCKNSRAKPAEPEMGELPKCRLESFVRPFTTTGVDYFGPIEITVRSHEKRYGVLFTCMSTRAVHLELAGSLSTDSCIMAIRRFAARRGQPKSIYSDNGTNFVGADNELRHALEALDQEKIQADLTMNGTEWHFIPPLAPHMGGTWERLVRSVKVALNATLKERYPKEETLRTLLAEAEQIINSRPLTHVSTDPDDPEALTPNHFLLGTSGSSMSPGVFEDCDMWLRKQWRAAQRMADMFWKRWVREYLPTLTRRTKWHEKKEPVKVGDVVVVADDALKRNCWPMGRVTSVYPGKDKQVRVVEVKTAHGEYRRPVSKICVLDTGRIGEEAAASAPGVACCRANH